MAKPKTAFECEACGAVFPKWMGRCTACGEWSTLIETVREKAKPAAAVAPSEQAIPYAEVDLESAERQSTGLVEVDRLLGGGLVRGSLVLIGGDPGIGKSTLMLQVADGIRRAGRVVLYVSGEESAGQVKLRGDRIGIGGDRLFMLSVRDLDQIESEATRIEPAVIVLDSIQTVFDPAMMSPPGSVAQVREATHRLMRIAKERGIACFLIGHITKEGAIAGPKSLEHMVDTVMYFEGDKQHTTRILRVQKNRFGSASEIAIFTMGESGLRPVDNPSAVLLKERPANASGSVVTCCMEGTQPLLLEVQALVSSGFPGGTPRRMTTGLDHNRVAMLLAVIEKKLDWQLGGEDVFLNVPGGLSIEDPAADLAVASAVWSSVRRKPIPDSTVVIGEVGLTGEIRAVTACQKRIAEARALGYRRVLLPANNLNGLSREEKGIGLSGVRHLREAVQYLAEEGPGGK